MTEQELLQNEPMLKHENGKFISPFKDYPGFVQFPYPFTGESYKIWLKETRDELPELEDIDKLPHFAELRSAVVLIEEYELQGCPPIEIATCEEVLPVVVQVWLRTAVITYLNEQFDLKNLLELSETS